MVEIGIEEQRIVLSPDPVPVVISEATVPLERPEAAAGKALLLYSGNWGVAHDYRTFLEAYRQHHREGTGGVVLWLNAVGAAVGQIETFLRDENLPYLRSEPLPLEQLASLLITPDAHLITLSDAFVGYVLPSKVHGCIASKKPILFIGSNRSDVHRLCQHGAAGYHRVSVGDMLGCIAALEHLAKDSKQQKKSGDVQASVRSQC